MDEATRQRIFEPFFTTRETGAGTGLGLSMVQGIVAQSGGYIDVDTKLGEGTTFSIYLPLRSGERTSAAASGNGTERAAGERETILVVEDRAEVRDYVVEVLKTSGYGVMEAADASEALRLAANTAAAIHLVLTDVVMPGISGIDLVKRLGGMKRGIKALFMSGYSDQNASLGALPDGSAFLSKPFSPAELVAKIQSVL
jgi:CheY-like chemotaxis protein